MTAHINRIGTALPPHDVHPAFLDFARTLLGTDKERSVFDRMAARSGISHRFSDFRAGVPGADRVDADGFYNKGRFPTTAARMRLYETRSVELAMRAVADLDVDPTSFTHIIVASCTGFMAPGLDQVLAARLGMAGDVQRATVGFMGCYAAVPALRLAADAVRADRSARVLVVNVELCSLHMQETADLETILSFVLFGDGCTAALVTADKDGFAIGPFRATTLPDSADLITWRIGDQGFDMRLSGKVPGRIATALRAEVEANDDGGLLRGRGIAYDLWAVHAGGRTVLDAVEQGLRLPPEALATSRAVLGDSGNMSSATIMFILARMLDAPVGRTGLAMAFGPGVCAETFTFARV